MYKHALATALNAVATLAPQLVALVLLDPHLFGRFSVAYLVYAFGVSLTLSIVAEPWHLRSLEGSTASWASFAAAGGCVALPIGAATYGGALVVGDSPALGGIVASAVAIAVWRSGVRYFLVQQKALLRANLFDLLFVAVFAAALVAALLGGAERLFAIYLSWAGAGLLSLVALPLPTKLPHSPVGWIREYAPEIRRLLGDSLLMDIGAIFVPMLLAPLLGTIAFGTYRALSNMAAPVRLVLNPLRPQIMARRNASRAASARMFRWVLAGGLILSLAAGSVLLVIEGLNIHIGVLNSLAPYALAVAATVFCNFIGHYSYIRARGRFTTRGLLLSRVVQTVLVSVLPIAGVLAGGLAGAIIGSTLANVGIAIMWWGMDRRFDGQSDAR